MTTLGTASSRTAVLAVAALSLTACSGSDTPTIAAQPSAAATPCPTAATTVPAPDSASTDLSTKPTIEVPSTPPPDQLVVQEIVAGDGPVACAGDTITVRYVGVTYADGKQFDASWDRNMDFPFTLGAGSVIQGWDQGLQGMRVGGRRRLIIPADLAYGAQGRPPVIPASAALVFDVDLLQVA